MNDSTSLPLEKILLNGGTQCRAILCVDYIEKLADAWVAGDEPPAVIVYHNGTHYWLVDGFHRYHAAQKCGYKHIAAKIVSGTLEDAVQFALSANYIHDKNGQPRSKADIAKTIGVAITTFPNKSDVELGKLCKVSDKTIAAHRVKLNLGTSEVEFRLGGDGKTRRVVKARAAAPKTRKAKGTEAIKMPLRQACGLAMTAMQDAKTVNSKIRVSELIEVMYLTISRHMPDVFGAQQQTPVTIADIYDAYPRKVGRNEALKAIEKSLTNHNITPDSLLKLTLDFTGAVSLWPEQDREFIPHGATWYNRASFLDDQKEWQRGRKPAAKKETDYAKF